jgi:hypothetical protein
MTIKTSKASAVPPSLFEGGKDAPDVGALPKVEGGKDAPDVGALPKVGGGSVEGADGVGAPCARNGFAKKMWSF